MEAAIKISLGAAGRSIQWLDREPVPIPQFAVMPSPNLVRTKFNPMLPRVLSFQLFPETVAV